MHQFSDDLWKKKQKEILFKHWKTYMLGCSVGKIRSEEENVGYHRNDS